MWYDDNSAKETRQQKEEEGQERKIWENGSVKVHNKSQNWIPE